jgi:HAD superfamily hydrolase (TIGR01509 family)
MIKAAIFDLDGTLIDSELLWVESLWLYLMDRGFSISRGEATDIVYGRSWTAICDDVFERFPELRADANELEEALRVRMIDLQKSRGAIVIDGSVELLKRLSADMPVCIVSGSPSGDISRAVDMLGIRENIEFFIGAEEYPIGKPDPTCFLMAAERLNTPPAECIVFEDSAAGVCAAKSAGMKCVALVRPSAPEQDVSDSDLIVDDLAGLDLSALGKL